MNTAYILLANTASLTIGAGVVIFLVLTLALVAILLVAKHYLVKSGDVKITMNGETDINVSAGSSLLSSLANQNVFLPSACGGKGSCGQCKVQVVSGGGEILPTETVHFSRREMKDGWRLGCQVKVKEDMSIKVPESVLSVKEWECEVISKQQRCHIHQRIYRCIASRRTHALRTGLVCTD